MEFPTTIWSTIHKAGARDDGALERFARRYEQPVRAYIRSRGFKDHDCDDVCQEVFVRLLKSDALSKANAAKGRFRALLLTITKRTIQDRLRKKTMRTGTEFEISQDAEDRDPEFDRDWALSLAEQAMTTLRVQGSPYYDVLKQHLQGKPQNRNKLWIARGKMIQLMRKEIAMTCSSKEELEEELAYLSTFLG